MSLRQRTKPKDSIDSSANVDAVAPTPRTVHPEPSWLGAMARSLFDPIPNESLVFFRIMWGMS